jgi:hypothetical protein
VQYILPTTKGGRTTKSSQFANPEICGTIELVRSADPPQTRYYANLQTQFFGYLKLNLGKSENTIT